MNVENVKFNALIAHEIKELAREVNFVIFEKLILTVGLVEMVPFDFCSLRGVYSVTHTTEEMQAICFDTNIKGI